MEPRLGRTAGILIALIVPLALAAIVGVALTWPTGPAQTVRELTDSGVTFHSARVTGTELESCEGSVEDRQPDGTVPDEVECLRVEATVSGGEHAGQQVEVWATAGVGARELPAGTRITVERYPAADGEPEIWAWQDFDRALPLAALALAFGLVTVLVAGMRGARALLGLVFAFAIIGAYMLPGLVAGTNPLVVTLAGSIVIMIVVLYVAHGLSLRTSTALLGTMIGLAVTTALGVVGANAARLSGVASEDAFQLSLLLGENGASALRGLFLCGVVLAGLGVLNDVTITQASAVWELRAADPDADRRTLFSRAMRIGRDHIASTVYTIVFAYMGASLPILLLVQLYGLPLRITLTGGFFAEEIVRTLVGSIGLVLAIPLTTAIAALVATTATPSRHRVAAGLHQH